MFSNNSYQENNFERLHENNYGAICISNEGYTLFENKLCCSVLLYLKVSFTAELEHLSFSMEQQLLSRLAGTR